MKDLILSSLLLIRSHDDVGELLGRYVPLMKYAKPLIGIIHRFQFPGRYTYQPSRSFLKTMTIPHLIISGEFDDDIPLKGNYSRFLALSQKQPLLTVMLAKNHRHNPYLIKDSEDYVIDHILKGTQQMALEDDPQKREAFFSSIDYEKVGQHDPEILRSILDFLQS